ncbi:MAG: sulfotransferase family 2 domain-containing protein [Roseovarius sp.]|nr:sulfotransferase family 2 domain-containing protein [Roseovarius sp.]
MLVFSKAKLVFLSVPKTGSTAYQAALLPQAAIAVTTPPELKHAPVFRYNRFFRPMIERFIAPDVDVLAVMREPISWLGSWYRYRQRPAMDGMPNSTRDISFDAFVDAYCMGDQPGFAAVGAQSKFLEPQRNGTCVTHLFRYEDQPALLHFLEERLETPIKTEHVNSSPSAPLELTARTEARVRRKFSSDFALWDGIGEKGAYRPMAAKPKPEA